MTIPPKRNFHELGLNHEHNPECFEQAADYIESLNNRAAELERAVPKISKMAFASYIRKPSVEMRDRLAESWSHVFAVPAREAGNSDDTEESLPHEIALFNSVAMCLVIDRLKVRTIGRDATTDASNGLMGNLLGEVAWAMDFATQDEINRIDHLVDAASQLPSDRQLWFVPKMRRYLSAMLLKNSSHQLLDSVHEEESLNFEDLRRENDQLVDSIGFLQKYGVKPCIAPAVPGLHNTKEWLLTPRERVVSNRAFDPLANLTVMFGGSSLPISSSETVMEHYQHGIASLRTLHAEGIPPEGYTTAVALGKDGHLYSASGQRWLDYISGPWLGKYEQLRAELLSIYYDSVVPVYVTELVEQEAALDGGQSALIEHATSKNPADKLRRLVLARRVVATTLHDEIIQELEHPNRDLVTSHREMAIHDVINHIRCLPKNFRASSEARQACLEDLGIELADYGETYVRPHQRGSRDTQSKGHKAVFSAGRVATQLEENET